jgi:hypothetical protein
MTNRTLVALFVMVAAETAAATGQSRVNTAKKIRAVASL